MGWHGNFNNGSYLVWWNCHSGMNQRFSLPWVAGHKVHKKRIVRHRHTRHHFRHRWVSRYTWTTRSAILQIRNDRNHRNVDIWQGRPNRHQPVKMWNRHNGWNQRWRVVNVRGNKFMLKSLKGNLYFGSRGGHWVGLQRRATWLHYNAKTHQLMRGRKCMDIWHGNFNNGSMLVWWNCHHGANQKFTLPWVAGHKVSKKRIVRHRHVRHHFRHRWVGRYTWTTRSAILQIRNDRNHRNVDIWQGKARRHQPVKMWNRHNGWNQRWRVVNVRGNKFQLKSLKGNKYFGSRGGHW